MVFRNPLINLTLQAESIISPESHLSYLRAKQLSSPSLLPKSLCKLSSSSISELAPGNVAVMTGILTISSPSSSPPPPHTGSSFLTGEISTADYDSQSRAIQRILLLNGGALKAPSSVLVALSNLIHLRIQSSSPSPFPAFPLTSTSPRVQLQLEESPSSRSSSSPSHPHLSFCGLLPIPPEVRCSFDCLKYRQECRTAFAPLAVIPLFDEEQQEQESSGLWDHLNGILSSATDSCRTVTVHGVLSSPSSYLLPSPLRDDQELNHIRKIISAHSSSVSVPFSSLETPLGHPFLELSLGPLSCQALILSQERGPRPLLHIFPSVTESQWETNSLLLSSLRYNLLAIQHCKPSTLASLFSVKQLTKGAIQRLLRSMEHALQSLLLSIKYSAVAWREMNLLKSQAHRCGGGRGGVPQEGRLYLGSRLFTFNPQLLEDIVRSQLDSDEAMISFLRTLQQFLR
jgi:hypothetical protein